MLPDSGFSRTVKETAGSDLVMTYLNIGNCSEYQSPSMDMMWVSCFVNNPT